jgi:hypothetical protein
MLLADAHKLKANIQTTCRRRSVVEVPMDEMLQLDLLNVIVAIRYRHTTQPMKI